MTNEVDLTDTFELSSQLKATEIPGRSLLPFALLHGKKKKTTKLAANSDSTAPITGSNRWYDFTFSEPVFLNEIIVDEENYSTFSEFVFKWTPIQGDEVTQNFSKKNAQSYRAPINQLVRQVSFKPPKRWLTETKITRVQLVGFQLEELDDFVRLVGQLDDYKASIVAETDKAIQAAERAGANVEAAKNFRVGLDNEISEANDRITDLNNKIGRLTEERKTLLEDISKREGTISELDERRNVIHEAIEERTTVRKNLTTEITKLRQELRALEDNVKMFPTEIGAFVSQVGKNIGTY